MKKIKSITILLLVFSSILVAGAHVVEADSTDYIRFSSGAKIFSPLNRTYNSRFLTLNLTFGAGLGIKCSLNYSIDRKYEGPIPLVRKNPTELHVVNEEIGSVTLPELSEGSHNLTVYVLCGLYNYHGVNPPGAPFKPTFPGSTDYVASWADTLYFTIDTQLQENTIPEFPSWAILPLLLTATLAAVIWKQKLRKTSNNQKETRQW